MGIAKIARRTFLIGAGVIAGGLATGYYFVRKPFENPLLDGLIRGEAAFTPFVKIASDDTITVIVPRAEMGQGVQTTLAALVAEELDVSLDAISIEHGPASPAYFNSAVIEDGGPFAAFDEGYMAQAMRAASQPLSKLLAVQVTGGSTSTRDAYDKMRNAGAAARQMLMSAAAAKWNVDVASLKTENGLVIDPASSRTATYGSLALQAASQPVPANVQLKAKSGWKLLGKPQKRVDLLAKITGKAVYGIDVDLPQMLYGTVRMSPRFGAKAKSVNDAAALKIKGVLKIVPLTIATGSGFGVLAQNTWAAFKGADALEIEWEDASYPQTSAAMFAKLHEQLALPADFALRNDGDVDAAFADAPPGEILEAVYQQPFLAHACMEPMNATAQWKDGRLDIWAPNQVPTIIQMLTAPLVGIKTKDVRVHTTFIGGGFGRRLEADYAILAVEMAKAADERPVKVLWTREEDIRHDVYRPAAVAKMKARFVKGEGPVAVDMAIAAPSIIASVFKRVFPSIPAVGPDKTMTEGAHDQPCKIANYRVAGHKAELGVPLGFWRSVGNSGNGFLHESFMDEIAMASGIDPLDMRLKLMADYPAATGALKKAADMAGWGRDPGANRGLGIAHVLSFGTWVAQIAEVNQTLEGMRIEKIWCAADIGQALDPAIVEAQLMSGIVFGLSAAIGQEITFENGEVIQSSFTDYDCLRMNQCPEIEVALLETWHRMGGAGEPGTPPSIPALGNAIHAATGKRLRTLPFNREIKFA